MLPCVPLERKFPVFWTTACTGLKPYYTFLPALLRRRKLFPMRYEPGFYIPEDDIPHSHCRENLESYIALNGWDLLRRSNVFAVRYELDSICKV
jgi:hypothetical protein